MGQQQLLLLLLTVIVVGVAITIAIQVYNEQSDSSNATLMTQTCLNLVSEAAQWSVTPAELGGGNRGPGGDGYAGLTWEQLGKKTNSQGFYTTRNGYYAMEVDSKTLTITAVSPTYANCITMTAVGVAPPDITTDIDRDCDRDRP